MGLELTRRRFLWLTSATIGASLLSASCGGGDSSTPTAPSGASPTPGMGSQGNATQAPSSSPTQAAATETPTQGGVLAFSFEADPSGFDLHVNTSDTFWLIPCFSSLAQYDPLDDTKIIPDLAERWEISDDRLTYTFYLREGVVFHNGAPLTSRDVKVSLERIINPPSGLRSSRRPLFDMVNEVQAPDERTVRIILREPDESLLASVAQGWICIYPADLIESGADLSQPENMIGTGPFKFKSFTPGVSVELERNPDYYVPGRPYLDGLIWYIIPDPNQVINAFISGQIHFYRPLSNPPEDLLRAQIGDDLVMNEYLSNTTYGVDLNGSYGPWQDPRVRQAATLVIDRDAAIAVINKGRGKVSGHMQPDGQWALPENRLREAAGYGRNVEENIARAKQLLAEAGHANGFDVRLLTSRGERSETPMNFVRDQWAKIGIRATLDVADFPVFIQRRYVDKDWDAVQSVHGPAVDDPKAVFGPFLSCDAPLNTTEICQDELLNLYQQQAQEPDPAKRKELVNNLDFNALNEVGGGRIFVHRALSWEFYRQSLIGGWKIYRLYYGSRYDHVWLKQG